MLLYDAKLVKDRKLFPRKIEGPHYIVADYEATCGVQGNISAGARIYFRGVNDCAGLFPLFGRTSKIRQTFVRSRWDDKAREQGRPRAGRKTIIVETLGV